MCSLIPARALLSDKGPVAVLRKPLPKEFMKGEGGVRKYEELEGLNSLKLRTLFGCFYCSEPLLSSLLRRMPDLETLEIMKLVNCPETFTPDMRCIMGESPLVKGYFVLAGMNSAGLSFGGGAGR